MNSEDKATAFDTQTFEQNKRLLDPEQPETQQAADTREETPAEEQASARRK